MTNFNTQSASGIALLSEDRLYFLVREFYDVNVRMCVMLTSYKHVNHVSLNKSCFWKKRCCLLFVVNFWNIVRNLTSASSKREGLLSENFTRTLCFLCRSCSSCLKKLDLFSKTSRLARRLTQPPIQWVPGTFPSGDAASEAWDWSLTKYNDEVKNMWS